MGGEPHTQIQISGSPTPDSILAHPGNPDRLALMHPRRNTNFENLSFGLSGAPVNPLQRNGSFGSCECLFQRDQDIALEVTAPARKTDFLGRSNTRTTKGASAAELIATTKELLKKVAKARAAVKVELHPLFAATTTAASPAPTRCAPEAR